MFRTVLTTTALAAAMAFAPRRGPWPRRRMATMPPHMATIMPTFDRSGCMSASMATGPRDIILIPGLSSSPEVWDSTVAHLGDGWRVHRIHVQGFAGAPAKANAEGDVAAPVAEEIARYIREAGLTKPVVVGHSMGGTMGMMLAARHPDLVGKLMVVDMVPFMGAMFGAPGVTADQVRPIADQIHAGHERRPRRGLSGPGRGGGHRHDQHRKPARRSAGGCPHQRPPRLGQCLSRTDRHRPAARTAEDHGPDRGGLCQVQRRPDDARDHRHDLPVLLCRPCPARS